MRVTPIGLVLFSMPPEKHAVASPRSMIRTDSPSESSPLASEHVIVFEGPSQPWMMVTWHASMLGRYLRSHNGWRFPIPTSPHFSSEKSPLSSLAVTSALVSSSVSAAMKPAPMWHPTRLDGYVSAASSPASRVTSPASAAASEAATTASSVSRAMTLVALR